MRWRWLFLGILAAGGCGASEEEGGIALEIEYPASTVLDPGVERDHAACVALVRPTHFHGTWDNLRRRPMRPQGSAVWRATSLVRSPGRYALRIEDPNTCGLGGGGGADGSVFRSVIRVNGTLLTDRTFTDSAEGPRSSFNFVLLEDGTVQN